MNFIKPPTTEQVLAQMDHYFLKILKKNSTKPLQVRVFSPARGIDYTFPQGSSNRPYHIASVGKVFTAVLIQMLAERGKFSVDDPIHPFFALGDLDRLFVHRNVDHKEKVTIRQLLGHTSGIADYFEGKTTDGTKLITDVLVHTDKHWTPQMLVDYTRERQEAIAAPGVKYNYSDTGYILLGLLIEKVTEKSFGSNLVDEFFRPLDMADSYLMFYTEPANKTDNPIEPIWFDDKEVSRYESLSCDWAGGGIVSTTDDLLKFNRALREGRLIQPSSLAAMDDCPNRFHPGIYYGLGMMEIRFKEFFFLLGHLPNVKGHIGIMSTHMFYDPIREAHIILNFGSTNSMVASFRALIQIENLLFRMR